ncbi:MAG: DUF2061 domain-containing protein [Nitrospinota bacterium]
MRRRNFKREALLKALSYRLVAMAITGTLVYAFTRDFAVASTVSLAEAFVKVIGYWIFEVAWVSIRRRRNEFS